MTIEFMRPKSKHLAANTVAEILYQMHDECWTTTDAARFLDMWRQSNRVMTLFGWLSRPEDDLDRKLMEFLREFLLVDD